MIRPESVGASRGRGRVVLELHRHRLYLLCLPAFVLFAVFEFYPLLQGVRLSFTDWNGFSQTYRYVGLDNYVRLFQDTRVATALRNTLIYGLAGAAVQNVWGLLYALLLNQKFPGRGWVRAVIYLPVLVSGLILGYIWYFLMQYDGGALNDALELFGGTPVDWLAEGPRAVGLILFISSMQYVGQAMVIYLAGLQSIPTAYYEAAAIDGATLWRRFVHITLPLLAPAILSTVILKLIGGLQLFDVIMALTNGGPGFSSHSIPTLINYLYFGNQNAGYSASLGIALFVLILSITLFTNRMAWRKGEET
ncbi:glycerol-3-phosphate ABC transporter permease [Paenibacillus rigui]|uniref:Glycerol-3-phosphate ABC transporter permease n=1 Tax=Paenibacillus rigui TaxID=554312 RepID=A0A229UY04_9BACL|nr:glycerol-3-phosphate ABC transporter permease [Paenibacillus rigui]